MSEAHPKLLGTGYAVPKTIRLNNDPIFDWLRAHAPAGTDLFQGYVKRRVLAPGEGIMGGLTRAARAALKDAAVEAGEIDLLLGTVSVGEFNPPNALSQLHSKLKLPEKCWTVALANDFSNFNAGLLFADAMIRAGRAKKALVCIGTNWSQYVSYQTPQAISAADGAAAAVVGNSRKKGWRIVDQEVLSATQNYGTMTMQPQTITLNPLVQNYSELYTAPTFQITPAGAAAFKTFGMVESVLSVTRLLKRNKLKGADISLITHQASGVLIDAWTTAIKPAQYIQTLTQYANMTAANIPVNLAWGERSGGIMKDHLVLFALGPDMHAEALLLMLD